MPPPPYKHKDLGQMHKKKSFTLAETLITLAIVGIVAALTIPNLINNYQANELRSRFLEANTIVKNTSGLLINDGVHIDDLTPQQVASYFKSTNFVANPYNIYTNFNRTRVGYGAAGFVMVAKFDLPNGMTGSVHAPGRYQPDTKYLVAIDINGVSKQPNRYGHDLYVWYQNKSTGMFEITGSPNAKRDVPITNSCYPTNPTTTDAGNGLGCGARALVEQDWFKNLRKYQYKENTPR